MEYSESILTELKKITFLLSKRQTRIPEPMYLNQKEAAAWIRVKEEDLAKAFKNGLIRRCKRQGTGFVYKIAELLQLAEAIDNGEINII